MKEKYDLDDLLENPDRSLTVEEYQNFDKYMAMTNDDKSADEVDISGAIDERIQEIRKTGTFWR